MNTSLFTRLYTTLTIFILTIFFVNFYFTLKTYREYHILMEKENLTRIIRLTESMVIKNYMNPSILHEYINHTAKSLNVRLMIIDITGRAIADSEPNWLVKKNYLTDPEIINASFEKPGFSIRYDKTFNRQVLHVAILENENFNGYIRASLFFSNISVFLDVFKKNIFFVALIILILSLTASYLLTRSVTKPIGKLAHVTHQIAGGNFDVHIPDIGSGEISDLSNDFRLMTKEIKNSFLNITRQKEELTNIIEAVEEKLLVIGSDGTIIYANKGFEDLINTDELTGRGYQKVIRYKQVNDIIAQTIHKQSGLMTEVVIDNKVYLCNSAYMKDIKESVLAMRDVSDLKNLENIKRDLIANVSHELRTPLTAIKGFLETLKDDLEGQNKKYLEIIERHTDRLIYIVQDLLILSRLEDHTIQPDFQNLKFKDIIEDTTLLLEKKARQKGLRLLIEGDSEIQLDGDRHQLAQLVINLIDNAIKYTEKGEIRIKLQKENESVVMDVQDTGIGIEKKHLNRLFERFYVVDSSRSRVQGGTGLGLSIVKHVVSNHNGKIEIASTPGEGTKVRILLPLTQSKTT